MQARVGTTEICCVALAQSDLGASYGERRKKKRPGEHERGREENGENSLSNAGRETFEVFLELVIFSELCSYFLDCSLCWYFGLLICSVMNKRLMWKSSMNAFDILLIQKEFHCYNCLCKLHYQILQIFFTLVTIVYTTPDISRYLTDSM